MKEVFVKGLKNKKMKAVISLLLILCMIVSYIPSMVKAEETEESNYIEINHIEISNGAEIVKSNGEVDIRYSISFDGVQTGFKNVQLTVIDKDAINNPAAKITSKIGNNIGAENVSNYSGCTIITYGDVRSGAQLTGNSQITFNRNEEFSNYEKDITVEVYAEYRNPITGDWDAVTKTQVVTANIESSPKVDNFSYDTNISKYRTSREDKIDATLAEGEYMAKEVKSEHSVTLSANNTGYAVYEIDISRTCKGTNSSTGQPVVASDINSVSNLTVGVTSSLDSSLYETEVIRNSDGTTKLFIKIGEEKAEYGINDVQDLSGNFHISVEYKIIEDNSRTGDSGGSTVVTIDTELNAEGITSTENQEGITYTQKSTKYTNNYTVVQGIKKFGGDYAAWTNIFATNKYSADLQEEISDGKIELDFITEALYWDKREEGIKEKLKIYNYNFTEEDETTIGKENVTDEVTKIMYVNDEEIEDTLELVNDEMTVKQIKITALPIEVSKIDFYKKGDVEGEDVPFFTATSLNMNFVANQSITEYYAVLDTMQGDKANSYPSWETTYEISVDKLKTNGLSNEEVENVKTVTRYQEATFGTVGNVSNIEEATAYINLEKQNLKYSYMALDIGEFDTNEGKVGEAWTEPKTITLSMYKNTDVIKNKDIIVENVNPIFFVKLPSDFAFSSFNVEMEDNGVIAIDETNIVKIDGEEYLEIKCIGTYNNKILPRVDIEISFDRYYLGESQGSATKYLTAYMITDNENYLASRSNSMGLTKNGEEVTEIFSANQSFGINKDSSMIQTLMMLECNGKKYEPNSSDDVEYWGEEEKPLIVETNNVVSYKAKIYSTTPIQVKNFLCRLPIENSVDFNSVALVSDESIEEFSLENLQNIIVYKINYKGVKSIINENEYTISYSTDNSTFENTLGEGVIPSTIKVEFAEGYDLESGSNMFLSYDMIMPEVESDEAMVGAVSQITYAQNGSGDFTLQTEAVFVTNGETAGTINLTKAFEGCEAGVAPEGASMQGINFELIDSEGNISKTGTTDAQGKLTFSNVEPGRYKIEETTTFNDYEGIGNLVYVQVGIAEEVNLTVENKLKRGTVTINKTWEDTNDQQGIVKFELFDANYSVEAETDEEGKATIVGVPYGTYALREISKVSGWTAETVTVTVDSEEEIVNVENEVAKGTLVINKEVRNDEETVKNITFEIDGRGAVSYINTEGNEVKTDVNFDVKIGETDETIVNGDHNITIDISEDETEATITITNLPLGRYTVKETEVPNIATPGGAEIERFIKVTKNTEITEEGQTKAVDITNKRKYGYIEIQKEAFLQNEDETLTEIGDKSGFKVRVSGNSYYGTEVDEIISLNEEGYGIAALEIGLYDLKEIEEDGYVAHYRDTQLNEERDGAIVEVTYNSELNVQETTTVNITNIHNGVGYVRVEKSLEGITDPQEVIEKGITFYVEGKNIAGGEVRKAIVIDSIDTQKNVAYGISEEISVGGEYQLSEDESTVPEFFEEIDELKVDLTTSSTQQNPLVFEVTNNRMKGNLEITTQTIPDGGELRGITYNVTEVEIKADGSYEKIGETLLLNGDNGSTNTSFAKLTNISAGNYLVELVDTPQGYKKGLPQIVEVPGYGTGYAILEIRQEQNHLTTLKISKEILNSELENATAEDFSAANLSADESFEVKLVNKQNGNTYFAFINNANETIVKGLEPGTYTVEEQYKIKYDLDGYYLVSQSNVETKLTTNEITIAENGTVEIVVKNIINTNTGFGGNEAIDNFNKIELAGEVEDNVTETMIYVIDEDGKFLSGATFELYDNNGNLVTSLGQVGTSFTTSGKKIKIKGLTPGEYTLKNTAVPNGYLLATDKPIRVFEDAVRIARIEIQTNEPRGIMNLSTVYRAADSNERYVSRSKYKVVDSQTGEVVKFIKTLTGDYVKSNLEDATETISLKAGEVEVSGLEVGTYQVGLVDVTSGYGMQATEPEVVTIVQNVTKEVKVEVSKKTIVQISSGQSNTMWLDENGELWIIGDNYNGEYGNGEINGGYRNVTPHKIEFSENVKIVNFTEYNGSVLALDNQGRVWSWGSNEGILGNGTTSDINILTPVCISEISNSPLDGIEIVEIVTNGSITIALDEEGKVWSWDWTNGTPVCISEEDNLIKDAYEENIKIVKVGRGVVIDSLGRIWEINGTTNCNCITEESEDLRGIKFIQAHKNGNDLLAIDENGKLWERKYQSGYIWSCISDTNENLRDITMKDIGGDRNNSYALGTMGKIWLLGQTVPTCISNETAILRNIRIEQITNGGNNNTLAVDSNNHIYLINGTGGMNGEYGGEYIDYDEPTTIQLPIIYAEHLEYNVKFKEVYATYYDTVFALDEEGNLWGKGRCIGNGDTNEHSNFEIISEFTEDKVVDFFGGVNSDVRLAVTQSGKVYVWGNIYNVCASQDLYGTYPYPYKYSPLDITDKFDLENGEKIVKVESDKNGDVAWAISNLGRAFVWGRNAHNNYLAATKLEVGDVIEPICVTDDIGEPLYNVNIEKVLVDYEFGTYVLDSEGNLWYWGSGDGNPVSDVYSDVTKPVCISKNEYSPIANAKMVDIVSKGYNLIYALDSEGKVWSIKSSTGSESETSNSKVICINDIKGSVLYNEYQKDSSFKIEKITALYDQLYLKDNKGKSWILSGTTTKEISEVYNVSKDIKDIAKYNSSSELYFIDGYGQLWENESPILNGEQLINEVKDAVINFPKENVLYNIEVEKIISDEIILDTAGNYWCFPETGEAYILNDKMPSIDNTLAGKTIKRLIDDRYIVTTENKIYDIAEGTPTYVMDFVDDSVEIKTIFERYDTNYNLYYIVLSTDGKIYTCGYGRTGQLGNGSVENITIPICLNEEIEELATVEFESLIVGETEFNYGTSIFAIDSEGKLWTWGYNRSGQLGTGDSKVVLTPVCLNTSVQALEDVQFESIKCAQATYDGMSVVALDSTGKLWAWGDNSEQQLATEKTDIVIYTPICISSIEGTDFAALYEDETFEVVKFEIRSEGLLVLGNNGKMYSCGSDTSMIGTNIAKTSLTQIGSGLTDITDFVCEENGNAVVAYGQNSVWAWGNLNISSGGLMPAQVNTTLEENKGLSKVVIVNDGRNVIALDPDGYLVSWGNVNGLLGFNIENNEASYINNVFITQTNKVFTDIYVSKSGLVVLGDENSQVEIISKDSTTGKISGQCGYITGCLQTSDNYGVHKKIADEVDISIKDILQTININMNGKVWRIDLIYTSAGVLNGNPPSGACIEENFNGITQTAEDYEISEFLDKNHVLMTNNKIYYLSDDFKLTYLMESEKVLEHDGIIVEKVYKILGEDLLNSVILAMDSNGDIWAWGGAEYSYADMSSYNLATNTYKRIKGETAGGNNPALYNPPSQPTNMTAIFKAGSQLGALYNANPEFRIIDFEVYIDETKQYVVLEDSYGLFWWYGDPIDEVGTSKLTPTAVSGYTTESYLSMPPEARLGQWQGSPYYEYYAAFEAGLNFTDIKLGKNYVILKDDQGRIWAFGKNDKGQVGNGTTEASSTTPNVVTKTIFSEEVAIEEILAWENNYIIVKDSNDKIWIWGDIAQFKTDYDEISAYEEIASLTIQTLPLKISDDLGGSIVDLLDTTIEIEGTTLVEQTEHKALDTDGNLYVWEKYTGGYESITDTICTTLCEYIIEPIYSTSNGWSVIKSLY